MGILTNAFGSFSDGAVSVAHSESRLVQPLNGREIRREAERRENRRIKIRTKSTKGFA